LGEENLRGERGLLKMLREQIQLADGLGFPLRQGREHGQSHFSN